MLAITCSSCQKKLSVKDDLAGKKVKCPGCGQVTTVPSQTAPVGDADMRAMPPASNPGEQTISPKPVDASDTPTNPSLSKPDATQDAKNESSHDSSLTDFLAPPQADDELGRLGQYRILKILGHGGMGVVFLGDDPKLGRKVAIKAMLPHLAQSKSSQQRFLREARAAAALEHDHIVAIHHVDEDRGAPYIVMPFLKGQPLDERLKSGAALPLDEILRIGREVACALDAAHEAGLIHRDIKPANIWLEAPHARVKILDFGLARAEAPEAGLTQQGVIVGTPAYMAPEQGRGETVDHRCDLFSLGVVLYRLCTGKMPFHGKDTVSTLMAVAMHEPPAPIKINEKLPQELSDLVMKLLEKKPADRTSSAAEVVQLLHAIETKSAAAKMAPAKMETLDAGEFRSGEPRGARGERANDAARFSDAVGSGGARRPVSRVAVALLALFGLLGFGAGGIYYWQTNNGIVKIEINDPDIKVAFDKNGPIITGVDKHDIKLTPGEFGLRVERGDLKFDTDKFILKRGETITLKIEWFKEGKLQVVQGDKVIGEKAAPRVAVAGANPHALAFDGKRSYVGIPTLERNAPEPATIEARVRAENQGPVVLMRLNGKAPCEIDFQLPMEIAGLEFLAFNKFHRHVKADLTMDGKGWVHVAYVAAKDEARIFINGRLAGQKQGKLPEVPVAARTRGAWIGAYPELKKYFFKGEVNGLRVSKVARYDKNFTPAQRFEPDADTLALYHFDEGSGDVLHDSSGNGHHGRIIGATWVTPKEGPTKATPPVTGQGPADPERKAVDLLKLIDPDRDAVEGKWRLFEGKLETPDGTSTSSRLVIPYAPPAEYQIEMEVERKGATGYGLVTGLPIGGRQCALNMDGYSLRASGLGMLDGKSGSDNETTHVGRLFTVNKPSTVLIQVRKNEVVFVCDGKTIFQWKGDPARLSLFRTWVVPQTDKIFLGSQAVFHVHKMTLTPLGPAENAATPPAAGERPADPERKAAESLIPFADLTLDLKSGKRAVIRSGGKLPSEPFKVTGIGFSRYYRKDLPATFVGATLLPAIAELQSLTNIWNHFDQVEMVTGEELARLSKMPAAQTITSLWLRFQLTSSAVDSLARFSSLVALDCLAEQTDSATLSRLKELSKLKGLGLVGLGKAGSITDKGIDDLCALELTGIEIYRSRIVDTRLAGKLANMPQVEHIDLQGSWVDDEIIAVLARGTAKLTTLNVSGNLVTDAGLAHLKKMTTLRLLRVSFTKVTEAGARKLSDALPKCKIELGGGKVIGPKDKTAPPPVDPDDPTPEAVVPPLDSAWLTQVAAMKHAEQLDAAKAELVKRNRSGMELTLGSAALQCRAGADTMK